MQNPCDELAKLIKQIPSYSSWAPADLAESLMQYRDLITKITETEGYKDYQWLAEDYPNLDKKIQEMLLEKGAEKQRMSFEKIVFEMQCALKVLTGKLRCNGPDAWKSILSHNSPMWDNTTNLSAARL